MRPEARARAGKITTHPSARFSPRGQQTEWRVP